MTSIGALPFGVTGKAKEAEGVGLCAMEVPNSQPNVRRPTRSFMLVIVGMVIAGMKECRDASRRRGKKVSLGYLTAAVA
jgi:hypothetical protein